MKYQINNELIDVIIERKNNRNTYIRVKEDMKIYVTTNYLVRDFQIKKIIEQNNEYILKMINKQKKNKEKENMFYYLGNNYDIVYISNMDIEIYQNRIFVKDKNTLEKWLKKETIRIFKERLDMNYNLFTESIPYPKLRIRKMKTRWGVCNKSSKVITLNSELIKYSYEKIDYVIIHELSHFLYFDHSKHFWNQVSKYCPEYKKIRKELKD